MISVIIPTVEGREDHLARCIDAYETHAVGGIPIETIVLRNYETCGEAWQVGAETAEGDYLHWTADDLTPHAGWAEAAIETTHLHAVPAPVIYTAEKIESQGGLAGQFESCGGVTYLTTDGGPAHNITAIPFCTREQWAKIGPHLPIHYYSDNWFTYRAQAAGFGVLVNHAYLFTHHWASTGRGAGMSESERMEYDNRLYRQAVRNDL